MHAYSASRRLRTGLCSVIGQIYMVTSVTKGREPVFADFRLGRLLVKELRRCEEQELVKSLAWVVMPDHVHRLFELRQNDLPMLMQQLKARSSIAIGKVRDHPETLWQSGYHDHAVRNEQDMVGLARYVVANPLRAGLVRKIGDYPLWDAVWM
ncbi:transposase [Pseudomonas tremae]|uniref:REP-associated tyrosine transposase n=1 Tax=Pseudomonas syringae group TaxID=136849 RepID=UPI0005B4FB08|nr:MULTISPECIES: transposase [Pseudomonas syringae group]MCQ3017172.1 transposase [Pseudomonas tremae]QGL54939.1 transposase [Pseudomonas coronafaciens pv. oryzae str. 1_6]RMM34103.1 Transposase [Pseudomonas coronafaciens pv. oryzae]